MIYGPPNLLEMGIAFWARASIVFVLDFCGLLVLSSGCILGFRDGMGIYQ